MDELATKAAPATPTVAEEFQAELNALLAKFPTIKLSVVQTITITEKQ